MRGIARDLTKLDLDAHQATKLRVRNAALADLHDAIAADYAALTQRDLAAATAAAGPA